MKSNNAKGFEAIHKGTFVGDCSSHESCNIIVGKKNKKYRAEAYIWHHEQDASKEGVKDIIAAQAESPREVVEKLSEIESNWCEDRIQGLKRAMAEALDEIE